MKLYTVEPKGNKPIIAICYDFDKTLSPTDMQAQGYIQSVNCDVTAFWRESNDLANKNGMDQNLSWMYKMVKEADGYIIPKKETLGSCSADQVEARNNRCIDGSSRLGK